MDQVEYVIKKRVIELHKDGECFRKLDVWFFRKHLNALKKVNDLEKAIAKIEKDAGWNYLLRALGRKAYFCKEMKEKLKLRYVSDVSCEYLILKAKKYAYLDDEREIENGIRFGFTKGKGPYRLVMELSHRSGRSREELQECVDKMLSEDVLIEKGEKLIRRYRLPQDRNKAYAFLARRGFANEVIQKVLRMQD